MVKGNNIWILITLLVLGILFWIAYKIIQAMFKAIIKIFSPKKAKSEETRAAIVELEKLMSLDSDSGQKTVKFADIDLGIEDRSNGKINSSLRIPPRKANENYSHLSSEHEIKVSFSYASYETNFYEQAKKHADKVGKSAEHVPFMSYWSTYEAMDKAQLKWYFFWRTEFRQGTVHKTDLSYLFINIYETLHLVGFINTNEAFEYLKRLWQSYREVHPKLDNYLVDWLVDFSEYYDLGKDPLALTWELSQQAVKTYNSDLIIASWLAHGRPEDLTINMMRTLLDYNPQSGKFYKDTKDKERILDRCKATLLMANSFYVETSGKSVFEEFSPKKSIKIERQAFGAAVFAFEAKMQKIATVRSYSTYKPLREVLTSAAKYGENLLRREMGFSGSRRGIDLPKTLEDYLKAAINPQEKQAVDPPKPKREVVIDELRLQKLQLESEAIRKQLLEGTEEESKAEDLADFNIPIQSVLPKKVSRFDIPTDTPINLLTELDEVAAILDSQVSHGLTILHIIKSRGWEALRADISAEIDDINFEDSLDIINELAINELGDLLIITEGDLLIVSEDYQDELEFLLKLPEYSTNPAISKQKPVKRRSGLSGEWEEFAERLTLLHAEALMQLVDSGSTHEAFETFALSHHAMPSLIIDELNEASLEVIGDQIINSYAEPIHLEEEHHYNILKVITWYYSRGEQ